MAASKLEEFHSFIEDECCCPICLEEFFEPKSFSKCLHNVCEKCLEKMCSSDPFSSTIQCPVCREESQLPRGGVAAMPTNKLLVRLIEKSPGRREKQAIKEALEETKKQVKTMKQHFEKIESSHSQQSELNSRVKNEISSTAEKLVGVIREQEKQLLAKVDELFIRVSSEASLLTQRKEEVDDMLERAAKCMEVVDDILRRGNPAEFIEMKEIVLLQLQEFHHLPVDMSEVLHTSDTKFVCNTDLEDLLRKKGVGQLTVQNKNEVPPQTDLLCGACGGGVTRRGMLIETLHASDFGETEFSPYAVAVSQVTGDIAILNESKRRVHVMSEEGKKVCTVQIQYGDLHDLAYSMDGNIIVVNYESSRLLHYNGKDGMFQKKRVEPGGRDISFKFISVDHDGRLIVSCELADSDGGSVQVYDSNRNLMFSFGEGELTCTGKAVFCNEEFYVSNEDCIKVFDCYGDFMRQFGDFFQASDLEIDERNENLIISDHDDNTLHVFKLDGTFVAKWETRRAPTSVALTRAGRICVTCYEDSCVQYFSYLEL